MPFSDNEVLDKILQSMVITVLLFSLTRSFEIYKPYTNKEFC